MIGDANARKGRQRQSLVGVSLLTLRCATATLLLRWLVRGEEGENLEGGGVGGDMGRLGWHWQTADSGQ